MVINEGAVAGRRCFGVRGIDGREEETADLPMLVADDAEVLFAADFVLEA